MLDHASHALLVITGVAGAAARGPFASRLPARRGSGSLIWGPFVCRACRSVHCCIPCAWLAGPAPARQCVLGWGLGCLRLEAPGAWGVVSGPRAGWSEACAHICPASWLPSARALHTGCMVPAAPPSLGWRVACRTAACRISADKTPVSARSCTCMLTQGARSSLPVPLHPSHHLGATIPITDRGLGLRALSQHTTYLMVPGQHTISAQSYYI